MNSAAVRLADEGQTSPPGINVIGLLSSSAGLGNTARLFIELLRRKGFAVAGFDVEAYAREEVPNLAPGMLIEDVRALPFDHNLVIVSMDRLPKLWLRHAKNITKPRFRNAGLIFWELPVIPPAWLPALRMFDVMLTCSQYVRQTLETAVPEVPTIHAEHPLWQRAVEVNNDQRQETRARFGIPNDSIAFCCTFDPRSGLLRKNPLGAVKAWLLAFPSRTDVCLVIKSNGAPPTDDPDAGEILRCSQRDPRVHWIPDRIDHDEVMGLFSCCDIFVSLHRAEGLGLVPMEAMALGKLVIATGYSGNMTFMTEQNSLLVPYQLVEPRDDRLFLNRRFAGAGASWAEPDLVQAAHRMRWAVDNPLLAKRLGAQARVDVAGRQATAWEGLFLDDMLRLSNSSTRYRLRSALGRRILMRELLTPSLLSKTIRATLRR